MTAKKKKPAPPRNSFERALEDAKTKLQRAEKLHVTYLNALQELTVEIPYLKGIVQALTAPMPLATEPPPFVQALSVPPPPTHTPPMNEPPPQTQESFMNRFVRPAGRVTTMQPPARPQPGNSPDPDEFLRDNDAGRDLLS